MGKRKPPSSARPLATWKYILGAGLIGVTALLMAFTDFESYNSLYDAAYVGSVVCGECHTITYERWATSPHARMTSPANSQTVVGNFEDATYFLPEEVRQSALDDLPAARMFQENGVYYMALRQPDSEQYTTFPIEYAIGFQYRQVYLTREAGGVLRRLPVQWSVEQQTYFPYWNYQEGSQPSVADLWAQMQVPNSAWNLNCARCHTTHLEILDKDPQHTYAVTEWTDNGIACEACHGPGSQHVNYFQNNYINRIVAFLNSNLRGEPVAYIANPPQLTKGQDLSTCARCHGADIWLTNVDIYRVYEPGYSREGRINDISMHFEEAPLTPNRLAETVETYADGRPKGIGMLFRSFISSACYKEAEVRCYDCHDPHANKQPRRPDILQPSAASNDYCLACHSELGAQVAAHTGHEPNTPGAFCMDCHMPREITNLASGVPHLVRSHNFSSIPQPELSLLYGLEGAPNACQECHTDQSVEWAVQWAQTWWPAAATP